jgi:hypothetical protein
VEAESTKNEKREDKQESHGENPERIKAEFRFCLGAVGGTGTKRENERSARERVRKQSKRSRKKPSVKRRV